MLWCVTGSCSTCTFISPLLLKVRSQGHWLACWNTCKHPVMFSCCSGSQYGTGPPNCLVISFHNLSWCGGSCMLLTVGLFGRILSQYVLLSWAASDVARNKGVSFLFLSCFRSIVTSCLCENHLDKVLSHSENSATIITSAYFIMRTWDGIRTGWDLDPVPPYSDRVGWDHVHFRPHLNPSRSSGLAISLGSNKNRLKHSYIQPANDPVILQAPRCLRERKAV